MGTQEITTPRGRGAGAVWPALVGRVRAELAGLGAPALWAALALLLAVFLLVPQLPLRYGFDVGREEGVGSDLPYLQGFNTAERDELGSYRWSDDRALIVVPGVGVRELLVRLTWLPTPAAALDASPKGYELLAGDVALGTLPLRPEGGTQLVVVPAAAVADGALRLRIRTETFTLPGDPRTLGARLSGVELVGMAGGLPRAPDWAATLRWLLAVTLGWLAVRAALGVTTGDGRRTTDDGRPTTDDGRPLGYRLSAIGYRLSAIGYRLSPTVVVLAISTLMVALAALLDPPRWAFGARAALVACALAYLLVLGVRAALPPLARRMGLPLDAVSLGWLSLFVALSFALRFGGRLYPASMPGDIGFHHNRFNEAVWGLIYIVSVNRGVAFPYPPGPYIGVAPLTLLGLSPPVVLQLGAALADALSAVLVYAIAVRAVGQRVALLAAGIYVFTAATLMAAWWSFDTHIYTQFVHLILVAALGWALAAWQERDRETGRQGDRETGRREAVGEPISMALRPFASSASWAVGLLLGVVFLGHFGFLINTALMVGLLALAVWVASWRGQAWATRVRWPLTLALVGAGAFAAAFFYTAYMPLFLGQLETAQAGGLAAVAGREPVSRSVMWERLWRDGLVIHFGIFPLLLMPWGLALIWRAGRGEAGLGPQRTLLWLMLAGLTVAAVFALFPFVAGVTNSPRWMLFIAWAVAVGAAVATDALWRWGWWGRLATVAMGAVVLANTAWIWLGPMLWRIRPPEPF